MFEDTNMETLTLAAETMFCATPDCDHVASVAVFRPGDKVVTLACMHCVWEMIRLNHAPADPDIGASIPPGLAALDPLDAPDAVDSAAIPCMSQVSLQWLLDYIHHPFPPTA